jgi:glycosyltransferase involved in cell wall biosynthesis
MGPLVSVIMPCRNAEPMLRAALDSVFAQTHPNIELIFVDNGSADGSAELARSMAEAAPIPVHLLHCPEPGANPARNLGYAVARGEFIQWLDADDVLGPRKIERQLAAFADDPAADFVYCDFMVRRRLADGRVEDEFTELGPVDDQILRTLDGFWWPPHTYLIRRRAADRLQAERAWLDETKVGTDVEYSAIAALLGMRFLYVPAARVQYNMWSSAQLSGANTKYAVRVRALEAIYRRLASFARRPDVLFRVKPHHLTLLEQSWDVVTMPPGSVTIRRRSSEVCELRHIASGCVVEAGPREAAVAATMQALNVRRASGHFARLIAARAPSLEHDIPFIVETIGRFRRKGMLETIPLAEAAPV